MTNKQPEALRLAEWLEEGWWPSYVPQEASAELRRQHERIVELEYQLAAAPVPQWGKVGTCEWFDGYADYTDGGGPYKERVLYTAPNPPVAVPMELPEPVAKIECGSLKWYIPDASYSLPVRYLQGTHKLYTEQQVRQILTRHGT